MYLSPINFQSKSVQNSYHKSNKVSFCTKDEVSFGKTAPKISAPIQKDTITLKHHPDFYTLNKKYELLASNYFRRGGFYGSASEKFIDVINSLKLFFNEEPLNTKTDDKVKMLVGGIGESQEPFSLLATVKSLIGDKKIDDVLDMHTVDLQGKPGNSTLFKQSFNDSYEPRFVQSSFIADDGTKYGAPLYKTHRVKDDIFKYLSNVYNNPQKAKWKSRLQEAIKEYPDNEFNVVSINNTLGYIENSKVRMETIKNIYRILKPGGIFISDNRTTEYSDVFTPKNSTEIYPGIFQKKPDNYKVISK